MKKVLSILMLFVMFVVGVAPTIGMHFCGQNLRSVDLLSKVDEKSCCSQSAGKMISHTECTTIHKNCCETKEVQIATDSFQLQERVVNHTVPFFVFEADWFSTNYVASLINFDLTTTVSKYFPPDGFDAKDSNILGFICILRI